LTSLGFAVSIVTLAGGSGWLKPSISGVTAGGGVFGAVGGVAGGGAGGAGCVGSFAAKLAVTDATAVTVTAQVSAVPEQAPPQPVKVELSEAAADRLTFVPGAYVAEQAAPQLIPAGSLLTLPEPEPCLVTVRVPRAGGAPTASKVAVTDLSPSRGTLQAPFPEQAPPQLRNFQP